MIFRILTGTMLLFVVGLLSCGDKGARRLPESGFQVAFESHKIASQMTSGKTISANITVKNISPVTWPSKPDTKGRYAVNLSYHWLNQKGAPVVFEGLRTPLPKDLKPGESVNLNAAIQAPANPGKYTLEVTLVQEQVAWFPENKGAKLVLPVTVFEDGETVADIRRSEKTEQPHMQPAETGKMSLNKDMAGHAGSSWSVQLGSYTDRKAATSLAKKLKNKGYDAYVSVVNVKGKELHRVYVGRFAGRREAEKLRETLRSVEKLERAVIVSH